MAAPASRPLACGRDGSSARTLPGPGQPGLGRRQPRFQAPRPLALHGENRLGGPAAGLGLRRVPPRRLHATGRRAQLGLDAVEQRTDLRGDPGRARFRGLGPRRRGAHLLGRPTQQREDRVGIGERRHRGTRKEAVRMLHDAHPARRGQGAEWCSRPGTIPLEPEFPGVLIY
ncbi:hypothetical protein [Methylobacterium nodulans]|uniref:hypothetical protein n=1 Tax=Methylobacterium nodulans TaxID=114616 RepID=UPI00016188F3|nr:hypothetical protein [Methylobacterium nodulans]